MELVVTRILESARAGARPGGLPLRGRYRSPARSGASVVTQLEERALRQAQVSIASDIEPKG